MSRVFTGQIASGFKENLIMIKDDSWGLIFLSVRMRLMFL